MRSLLAVSSGAVSGAAARYGAGRLVPDASVLTTWSVNIIGCALIGWYAARLDRSGLAWAFLVTGCLGGFTTASAFAVDTWVLLDDGRPAAAAAYVVTSVGLGCAAVLYAGRLSAGRLARHRSTGGSTGSRTDSGIGDGR